MRKALLLIAVLLLCLCPVVFALGEDEDDDEIIYIRPTGRPQLAVYTIGHEDQAINRAFSVGVLYLLLRTGRFAPIARYEHFFAAASADNIYATNLDERTSMLARQSGAQYVCAVNMTRSMESYSISARMINVETGEVVAIGTIDSPLQTKADFRTATVATVNSSLRLAYLAGVNADELDNDYQAPNPLPAFVFKPAPPRKRPVYDSFDDAVERMFAEDIQDEPEEPAPQQAVRTAADVMADGRSRFTEPPAPPPPPPPPQRIDISPRDETTEREVRTRFGIRTGYNASNANVTVFSSTGYEVKSDYGNGWELGFVTSTGSSHWFFNSGANLIFRKPVQSSNLYMTETALAIPTLLRLAGGNNSAAIFLDAGLQFDITFAAKDDHNDNFKERSTGNIGFALGGGFGLGQHVEIDGRAIWGINDFADIPMQSGKKLFQFTAGLTYMFKERAP